MEEEREKRETEEEVPVIYAYTDGKDFDYSLLRTGKYKELIRLFLLENGAVRKTSEEGYYGEVYSVNVYYETKKEINFNGTFCNISIVWFRSFSDFLEHCESW